MTRAAGAVPDVVRHAAGVVHGKIRVVAAALGADRMEENVVDIEEREIRHRLLRHHDDGRADVLEF